MGDKRWFCSECGKSFVDMESMMKHKNFYNPVLGLPWSDKQSESLREYEQPKTQYQRKAEDAKA